MHTYDTDLGWDAGWAAAFSSAVASRRAAGRSADTCLPARVSRAGRGGCDVMTLGGDGSLAVRTRWGAALTAKVARDPLAVPVAGDWVVITRRDDDTQAGADRTSGDATDYVTEVVLQRRAAVVRAQSRGSSHGQVLAANADTVLVVEGMVPDPDLGRLERLLALAWASGARPMVALTKADLVGAPQYLVEDVQAVAPGVEVVAVEAPGGTGLDRLRALLSAGETIALVGASGVGKSTLVNALLGADVMATQELAAANKGRHTTVVRELHLVPGGGALIDTPGLRGVGLAGGESLDDVFAEVEDLAEHCRFRDCAHVGEPGCAVLAAVDAGTLSERRLASFRKLLREQRWQALRTDARLRALRRRADRRAGRAVLPGP
ncbi:MAG TPA: ribosome small subunit-dependent GTPase A [Actinomycetales bacterium]|nr:ribosome small subunit-dependent GTPase A [Actinomycetales bacterium]